MRHQRMVVSQYGGADAVQLVEEEVPEPKAGEVRVRVPLSKGGVIGKIVLLPNVSPSGQIAG